MAGKEKKIPARGTLLLLGLGLVCSAALTRPRDAAVAAGSASSSFPGGTGCTEEARECPDGSSVSRAPPSCEFAPCPTGTVASTRTRTSTSTRTRTVVTTVTRTRTRRSTRTLTLQKDELGAPDPENSGQAIAFCQSAAVSTMRSLLLLHAGKTEPGIDGYLQAGREAGDAAGLGSSCPPQPTAAGLSRIPEAGQLAQRLEEATGISAQAVLEEVRELASGRSQAAPIDRLQALLAGATGSSSRLIDGIRTLPKAKQEALSARQAPTTGAALAGAPVAAKNQIASGAAPGPAVPEARPSAPQAIAAGKEPAGSTPGSRDEELAELDRLFLENDEDSSPESGEGGGLFEQVHRAYSRLASRLRPQERPAR